MSVNYFNSAGTDLDNLFYINNGNAGAVGFIEASGQDLGNRYTNASTLGYGVGYVNSAGTDLGFLRGNAIPPHINSGWAAVGQTYINSNNSRDYDDGTDNQNYDYTRHWREVSAYINCGLSGVGTGQINYQLCVSVLAGGYKFGATLCVWDNDTTKHTNWKNYTAILNNANVGANSESGWVTVYNAGGGTTPSRNFSLHLEASWNDRVQEDTNVSVGVRVYQRMYSSLGDSGWWHNDIWFG